MRVTAIAAMVIVGQLGLGGLGGAVAWAGWNEEHFAHFFGIAAGDVRAVTGYRTPAGVEVTHVLLGRRYETSTRREFPGLVLMRCDRRQCRGTRVYLGASEAKIEILGVVDLGEPGAIGARTSFSPPGGDGLVDMARWAKPPPRWRWPALMVSIAEETPMTEESRFGGTVTGTHRHTELWLVSLRAADEARPEVFGETTVDRYPTGVGVTTSFRTMRGGAGDRPPLDIIATEQRHIDNQSACLEPPPTEYRLVYVKGRYERRARDPWERSGCH